MIHVPISEWKSIPEHSRIRGIVVCKLKRDVDSPLKALAELCNCASVVCGMGFRGVIRSGKFKNWLSFSASRLASPHKCCEGVYVTASNDKVGNYIRMALLAKELRLLDRCSLIIDDGVTAVIESTDVSISKMPVRKIKADDVDKLKPLSVVLGSVRLSVSCWNDCLPKFVNYVRTSLPFGEGLYLPLPDNYKRLDPQSCLAAFKDLIVASRLDPFSVSVEVGLPVVTNEQATATFGAPVERHAVETQQDMLNKDAALLGHDQVLVMSSIHYRHFLPDVCVW